MPTIFFIFEEDNYRNFEILCEKEISTEDKFFFKFSKAMAMHLKEEKISTLAKWQSLW